MVLLSLDQFRSEVADKIALWGEGAVAVDFETDGLRPKAGDKAFLLGVAYMEGGEDHRRSVFISNAARPMLATLFSNPHIRYLAHNAKFEMHFLKTQFEINILGTVWDTEVFARVEYNTHLGYSLQACAERIGLTKYKPLVDWLKKNKRPHHEAPEELIIPYVEQDAWLSLELYRRQRATFLEWQNSSPHKIAKVLELELQTTKDLFEIENTGLFIDPVYCQAAMDHEQARVLTASCMFQSLTGEKFIDSRKCLEPIFTAHKIPYGKTGKGNASFTSELLEPSKANPIVGLILVQRNALKRASTYWRNFIDLQVHGKIYPNIRQTGAKSFRMSITEPAAQTWANDGETEQSEYPIRRAFKPAPGCYTVSMDYAQMELRLMCDEAEDMGMIEAILTPGRNLHKELAAAANVPYGLAKNGRFAKLYGAGVPRVAETLGVPLAVSQRLCDAMAEQSPRVNAYIREMIQYVEKVEFGYNWLGRRYYFERGKTYKYPNYRIQGGCSEILRIAIRDVSAYLKANARPETRIVLPIHDELVFNWHKQDLHHIPKVRELMIAAHRSKKHLDMDVSISIGENFHDLEDFGDFIQSKSA